MHLDALDHVSLPVRDLDRSLAFYQTVLGLRPVERPAFRSSGAWMASGSLALHLTVNPAGNFRPGRDITPGDAHFAARVPDFAATERHLSEMGYSEAAPQDDPKRLVFRRNGPAPYQQVYLLDPDNHLIELNSAAPNAAAG